jgi:hypothetical protein
MRLGRAEDEQISLSTSGWNYFRPIYPTKEVRAGCLVAPILFVLALVGSSTIFLMGVVLVGLVQLLAIRSQRGAYATSTAIHFRQGLLGRRSVEIPLAQVDDVVAEKIQFIAGLGLQDLGDITVKCGTRYLSFECVRDARRVAQELLSRRDMALGHRGTP